MTALVEPRRLDGHSAQKPLVSIITPSYNQGRFIKQTIESVWSQDYRPIEHIIVDGGSTDNTIAILRASGAQRGITWVSERDSGQADAFNKGFRISHGDIIGWINSDDLYFDKKAFSYVVNQFLERPQTDIIYGDDVLIDENNRILRAERLYDWDYRKLLRGLCITQQATFLRRSVVEENQLNATLHYAMDLEYFLRLGRTYEFQHARRILGAYRVHRRQKRTASKTIAHQEDVAVLKSYGQDFGSRYHILRLSLDIPGLAFRRALGFLESLSFPNHSEDLAFDAPPTSRLSLLLSQLRPLR